MGVENTKGGLNVVLQRKLVPPEKSAQLLF